eukprot:g3383.t1
MSTLSPLSEFFKKYKSGSSVTGKRGSGKGGKNIVAISCGEYSSGGVTDSGELFTWGKLDENWVLGYPNNQSKNSKNATSQKLSSSGTVIRQAAPREVVFSLKGQNSIAKKSTSSSSDLPVLPPSRILIQQLSLGFSHGAAVSTKGQLFTWGANQFGQLGNSDEFETSHLPRLVNLSSDDEATVPGSKSDSSAPCHMVKCGWCFTIAIVGDSGSLFSWGATSSGQLGHGKLFKVNKPKKITALNNYRVTDVDCGYLHVLAVATPRKRHQRNDGIKHSLNVLLSWGLGENGQLGHGVRDNELQPREIDLQSTLTLGSGSSVGSTVNNAGSGLTVHCVDHIACGFRHSVATFRVSLRKGTSGGDTSSSSTQNSKEPHHHQVFEVMASWGEGKDGQLGIGDRQDRLQPVVLEAFVENKTAATEGNEKTTSSGNSKDVAGFVPKFSCVGAGRKHTVVGLHNGQCFAWGRIPSGTTNTLVANSSRSGVPLSSSLVCSELPQRIPFLEKYGPLTHLACGANHTMAVAKNPAKDVTGTLFCWGVETLTSNWGQLGPSAPVGNEGKNDIEILNEEKRRAQDIMKSLHDKNEVVRRNSLLSEKAIQDSLPLKSSSGTFNYAKLKLEGGEGSALAFGPVDPMPGLYSPASLAEGQENQFNFDDDGEDNSKVAETDQLGDTVGSAMDGKPFDTASTLELAASNTATSSGDFYDLDESDDSDIEDAAVPATPVNGSEVDSSAQQKSINGAMSNTKSNSKQKVSSAVIGVNNADSTSTLDHMANESSSSSLLSDLNSRLLLERVRLKHAAWAILWILRGQHQRVLSLALHRLRVSALATRFQTYREDSLRRHEELTMRLTAVQAREYARSSPVMLGSDHVLKAFLLEDGKRRLYRALYRLGLRKISRAWGKLRRHMVYQQGMQANKNEETALKDKYTQIKLSNRQIVDKARRSKRIMHDRLRTVVTRYGRDKICSLLKVHAKHTMHRSFTKWMVKAELSNQLDRLQRRKLRLRVKLDECEVKRLDLEKQSSRMEEIERLQMVFIAFAKWKVGRVEQRMRRKEDNLKKTEGIMVRRMQACLRMLKEVKDIEDNMSEERRNKGEEIVEELVGFQQKIDRDMSDAVGMTLVDRSLMDQ